jgi:hypothetical protein
MGGAVMLCPKSEDEGEHKKSDGALFLRREDEKLKLPAPAHGA